MRAQWFMAFFLAAGAFSAPTCVVAAENDAAFKSGLQPGDKLASFKCRGVTGPEKDQGKPLCYV